MSYTKERGRACTQAIIHTQDGRTFTNGCAWNDAGRPARKVRSVLDPKGFEEPGPAVVPKADRKKFAARAVKKSEEKKPMVVPMQTGAQVSGLVRQVMPLATLGLVGWLAVKFLR